MKEEYDAIPHIYSQELRNLIITMLLKDDKERPTTSNILDMPFVEKYMTDFITTRGVALKSLRAFERQATATAKLHAADPAHRISLPEERKTVKPLTAKERLQQRKEEESRKKFEAMTLAAKGAYQQMAEYSR